jgi:uncharacterized glyoxalase superfamily protein PhnB
MERTLMQIYTKGSTEAVKMYQKAFDAVLGYNVKNEDGTFYHSELDVYGQIISVAERPVKDDTGITGNTMQFCLQFSEGEEHLVKKAYDVLTDNGDILVPLGPCDYSSYMTDFIDKFGVRWCLFIA